MTLQVGGHHAHHGAHPYREAYLAAWLSVNITPSSVRGSRCATVQKMAASSALIHSFIHSFSTQPGRLLLEGGPLWPGQPGPPSPPGACSVLEGCAQR